MSAYGLASLHAEAMTVKWVCQLLLFGLLLQWLWGTYGHLVVHTLLCAGFSGIRSCVVTKALMSYAVSGAGPT